MKRGITAAAIVAFGAWASPAAAKVEVSYGPVKRANSTSYCLTGVMADGTFPRGNSVAMNGVPLGTRIRLVGSTRFRGARWFVVRDRIGHGSQLDFWSPSCHYTWNVWGRRDVRYQVQYRISTYRVTAKRKPVRR